MLKRHRITITLKWASIFKDITDKAYRMARLTKLGIDLSTESGQSAISQKIEGEISLSDEDMSLLKRAMREGLAEVVTMCDEYVWHKGHVSNDLNVKSDTDVTIVLMMPLNYNLAGNLSIGTQIHAYIVAKALGAWYTYTALTDKQVNGLNEQKELMQNARYNILDILAKRVRPVREGEGLTVIVDSTSGT